MTLSAPRHNVYYWKCDRAAAFHGTAQGAARSRPEIESAARRIVAQHFGQEPSAFEMGAGQGNHLTFVAEVAGRRYFVRIEDGPEQDNYVAVEACVMAKVRALGVPTPEIFAADASRREVPFAWQIMELIAEPDLNRHFKAGTLQAPEIAEQIGRYVATWQNVQVDGFGFFDPEMAQSQALLRGAQSDYASYFHTRLEAHLAFLTEREFLTTERVAEIRLVI